jgi:hypothetical protein
LCKAKKFEEKFTESSVPRQSVRSDDNLFYPSFTGKVTSTGNSVLSNQIHEEDSGS